MVNDVLICVTVTNQKKRKEGKDFIGNWYSLVYRIDLWCTISVLNLMFLSHNFRLFLAFERETVLII